jgi:hypothetical protein
MRVNADKKSIVAAAGERWFSICILRWQR